MSIEGWYYLHVNGDLIYKREFGSTAADIRESDLAVGMWPFDPEDREGCWNILVESLAAGAARTRVLTLAERWGCNDSDAAVYADRVGVKIQLDGNQWFAARMDFINLQESLRAFGNTALEAMACLAIGMGYKPSKMWGVTFKQLLQQP